MKKNIIINAVIAAISLVAIWFLVFSNNQVINALDIWVWINGVAISFIALTVSVNDLLANIIPEEEV